LVWFDDNGRAFRVKVFDPYPDHRTVCQRIRSRLEF
jgi:hypothetical protein